MSIITNALRLDMGYTSIEERLRRLRAKAEMERPHTMPVTHRAINPFSKPRPGEMALGTRVRLADEFFTAHPWHGPVSIGVIDAVPCRPYDWQAVR